MDVGGVSIDVCGEGRDGIRHRGPADKPEAGHRKKS